MANRLLQLHRVLKPTGSLYLHCDPTASHYLKIVLDGVFGKENYINELIWKRTGAHGGKKGYGPIHDTIFYYSKSDKFHWNKTVEAYDESYLTQFYRFEDERGRYRLVTLTGAGTRTGESGKEWKGVNPTPSGRHWAVPNGLVEEINPELDASKMPINEKLDLLDSSGFIYWPPRGSVPQYKRYLKVDGGNPVQDIIGDIVPLSTASAERLGYPTQKPLALLERFIAASSNEGDVVLDPFCGCGTAVHAAQKLNRQWIGIDITHLAINLIEYRLKKAFPNPSGDAPKRLVYQVIGTPKDLDAAYDLARRSQDDGRYQFQYWAVSLVDAQAAQSKKKGADGGIDGIKYFGDYEYKDEKKSKDKGAFKTNKIVVSVKSGKLKPDDIRSLNHVREREGAEIGLFISLEEPTRGMIADAASAGFYQDGAGRKFPRVQLLTIEGLLSGKQRAEHPDHAPDLNFKKAKAESNTAQKNLI